MVELLDTEAEVAAFWRARRPAAAFELVDQLVAPTPWLARLWIQVGSRRALVPLLDALEPELREVCARFIAEGPPPVAIPSGGREALELLAEDLGQRGLVHELAHCHLGLAELDLRVDERVAHVEAASALAIQLGDPALTSLVAAYEARLDTYLGEDDDARERADTAQVAGLEHHEPRAVAIGRVVRAILDDDASAYEHAVQQLATLGFATGFGLVFRTTHD